MTRSIIIAILFGVFAMPIAALQEPIEVEGGVLEGTPSWGFGVRMYRGIPFAAPPVGDLRWRPPQPVVPWKGVRRADRFGPACMQRQRPLNQAAHNTGIAGYSEDCLYLNVWTAARSTAEKLPVMVWIYGGGGVEGSGAEPIYDGNGLAKKGVVLVTINYRVNVFGWMAHPQLSAESPEGASGNYGALDQIAALKWVKNNISAFGGDPDNVTIFGESGGARSVNWIIASPLSKGLYHRAIAESHSVFGRMMTLKEAEALGEGFTEAAGTDSLGALRAMSAERILEAFMKKPAGFNVTIVDGWFLPDSIYEIFRAGKHNDVPLMTGGNSNEFGGPRRREGAPGSVAGYRAWLDEAYGSHGQEVFDGYPADKDEEVAAAYYNLTVDNNFAGHRTWAKLHATTAKSPAYLYLFSHQVAGFSPATGERLIRGAYHGAEILFAFDNLRAVDAPWSDADRAMADVVSSYWVNFATTGNPNADGLPKWPRYDLQSEKIMNLGDPLQEREINRPGLDAIAASVADSHTR